MSTWKSKVNLISGLILSELEKELYREGFWDLEYAFECNQAFVLRGYSSKVKHPIELRISRESY